MKSILSFVAAAVALFGLSSCCCMFSGPSMAEYRTVKKRACGHDTIVEHVHTPGVSDPKSGLATAGTTEVIKRKVPRYREVKERIRCDNCWRFYCPDTICCGSTGRRVKTMASAQGWSGSPNIGLIPTMQPLAD